KFSVATSRRWKDSQSEEWKKKPTGTTSCCGGRRILPTTCRKRNRCTSKAACRPEATRTGTVPIANPICGRRPPAHNGSKPSVRATLRREQWRNPRCDWRTKEPCSVGQQRESAHLSLDTVSTPELRLRVAHSGGEDRQLAVWQPRPRVPEAARAAVPVCPLPARGASWIRDNTPGGTSRAGTGKPR